MQPFSLIDALHHLNAAFSLDDPELPMGRNWWLNCMGRLKTHYLEGAFHGHEAATNLHGAITRFARSRKSWAKVKSFDPLHAYLFREAINVGLSWTTTAEGGKYWQDLYEGFPDFEWGDAAEKSLAVLYCNDGPITTAHRESMQFNGNFPVAIVKRLGPAYKPGQWPHRPAAGADNDPTMIRYLPRGKSCVKPAWVTAKPGKWLTAEYSDILSTDEIAEFAAKWRAEGMPPEMKLARTADEIARVYREGPSSCMSSGKNIDGIEPVRAYASGDFAVAYLERNGKPSARCVVHPEAKVYIRIYGDSTSLRPLLERAGYASALSADGSGPYSPASKRLEGARLALLSAPNKRPAHAAHETAGEPVAITPFFDVKNICAYFDRAENCIRLTYKPFPKSCSAHRLAGGYSIHAIPAKEPPKTHSSDHNHFYATVGSGGTNSLEALRYSATGREDLRPESAFPTYYGTTGTITAQHPYQQQQQQAAAYQQVLQGAANQMQQGQQLQPGIIDILGNIV